VHDDADWNKSVKVIINAKTDKISACNALDKVLINRNIPKYSEKLKELENLLTKNQVEILVDLSIKEMFPNLGSIDSDEIWNEEFLSMKIGIGSVSDIEEAISRINKFSGGHSTAIMTENREVAQSFMDQIDGAAVYHNVSTRFTDGGQLGIGAELAISTDKLHHRGPLGLDQLVTNKWYIFGDGQVRK
jgi:glutamate-5-semialdehyde dehydrogenase